MPGYTTAVLSDMFGSRHIESKAKLRSVDSIGQLLKACKPSLLCPIQFCVLCSTLCNTMLLVIRHRAHCVHDVHVIKCVVETLLRLHKPNPALLQRLACKI
jgi:hypothetical protein